MDFGSDGRNASASRRDHGKTDTMPLASTCHLMRSSSQIVGDNKSGEKKHEHDLASYHKLLVNEYHRIPLERLKHLEGEPVNRTPRRIDGTDRVND